MDVAAPGVRIPLRVVQDWAEEVLRRVGLSESDAEATATSLAFADARGVRTHGFMRLQTYVHRVRSGGINGAGKPSIAEDLGALAIVDADHVAGASSGIFAADLAIARAREHGVGCVIVRNSNHFGVAAFYGNRIADEGLLGIVACNTDKVMCAPSGGRAVLGTNPLAVVVPLPADARPQLDMATTQVSQGRLIIAAHRGETIPTGWAVDAEGMPTTSPADGLKGALLPMGGPKGFGLSFAIDTIVAISGALTSPEVAALYGDPSQPQRLGQFFLAIRTDAAMPAEAYRARIGSLVDSIHASGPKGGRKPMAPGEPELAQVRGNLGRIVVDDMLMQSFSDVAAITGIALPAGLPGGAPIAAQ